MSSVVSVLQLKNPMFLFCGLHTMMEHMQEADILASIAG